MRLAIFGLSISSSWGNGHATLWRGLCRALGRRGHHVVFFERDVPYYAAHRDPVEIPNCEVALYESWDGVRGEAERAVRAADVVIVTSYCVDAIAAGELVRTTGGALAVFYDLDSPVTLSAKRNGEQVAYIGACGLADFDLVLSYTGGAALDELKSQLRARRVAPLYGSVDPEIHRPVSASAVYQCDLSYLGTYAEDRQGTLERLFVEPARRCPTRGFLLGGSLYPQEFPWQPNMRFVRHVSPAEHARFYSSSRVTLNVTRAVMAQYGYCPSGRLFEAAACGVPVLSDAWAGLDTFFEPGSEVLIARTAEDVMDALQRSDGELARVACAARERTLAEHTADRRAEELENLIAWAADPACDGADPGRDRAVRRLLEV